MSANAVGRQMSGSQLCACDAVSSVAGEVASRRVDGLPRRRLQPPPDLDGAIERRDDRIGGACPRPIAQHNDVVYMYCSDPLSAFLP
jgi:hypothetical protein